ncbi:glutaredoxin family protein [Spiribacter vilamensis]|uniref:glutaredoxin family protein n=1 Tax=Spiribacter vilamensis TaxID=531306 RepID=UPI001B862FE7|nr:glutaredoxin family protein [Spiribacter vilamensis]
MRFYTTSGCRLCDEAYALLVPVARRRGVDIECVDIMDDPQAEATYAESIPVIDCDARADVLRWPFDTASLYRYLP